MNSMASLAIRQYKSVDLHGQIADANSHRLIQMLLQGALEKIAKAKGNMERKEISSKGENLGLAITIVGTLQSSLDLEKGGEIAKNLEALYEYMNRCLLEANISDAAGKLNEVSSLLLEVKGAWDVIPDEFKTLPAS